MAKKAADQTEMLEQVRQLRDAKNIERDLEHFINLVDTGRPIPESLLQIMKAGAKNFLLGQAPWQKGKGGRPKIKTMQEIRVHLLDAYGKCRQLEIANLLSIGTEAAEDVSGSIRKKAARGAEMILEWKLHHPEKIYQAVFELLNLDWSVIGPTREKAIKEDLNEALARFRATAKEQRETAATRCAS
jgi:hypothetical protein